MTHTMPPTGSEAGSRWQLEFPPEIQAQREPILAALDRAMDEGTVEAVREAQALASAWLGKHPEDLVIWDAGEPIAMLADALAWMEAKQDRADMEEWKRHKAALAAEAAAP